METRIQTLEDHYEEMLTAIQQIRDVIIGDVRGNPGYGELLRQMRLDVSGLHTALNTARSEIQDLRIKVDTIVTEQWNTKIRVATLTALAGSVGGGVFKLVDYMTGK